MGHLKNKEEKDMAVGRSVWEVVKGIFIAVGKLLYLTGKLVICLDRPYTKDRKKKIENGKQACVACFF